MTIETHGKQAPTNKLVRFCGKWFWPCAAWLEMEAEFGENVLLTAAGNASFDVSPASVDRPRLTKLCKRVRQEPER
jgi:hypothetical protein